MLGEEAGAHFQQPTAEEIFMQVSTKTIQPHTTAKAQSHDEKKFNAAWQRVVDQQKKNDTLRAESQAFARDIQSRIQDHEEAYMDAMYFACLHLLSFCGRKSLAQWQRQMLLEWAGEYADAMSRNPFSQHLDMSSLQRRMADAYAVAFPESQLLREEDADDFIFNGNDGSAPDREFGSRDMFEELFAAFEQSDAASASFEQHDEMHSDHAFHQEFFQRHQAHEQQRRDENLALKQLIRSSSVNKLFRKLAGILHPDKERDATLRMEKNRLMRELIQARDSNDIPKLFAFYAEYVGESPLHELGGNLDDAAQLLDRHFLDLREQEDSILDENPLAGALYRRFHRRTPAASKRAITKHLKELQALTNALRDLRQDISSVKRLKPYLEWRRDIFFREDVPDFM
ncbi:hypothetical protein CR155_12865 [Pollutimonas nitritireducens]|uniref:J domain-containing protein n=2 Tax=Pollutimonas nitritireducens TaxID=2045209 RepID=A0A2N4UF92_9BURK|nr:hypothetical protein CR155_12865 [Pollutimonas nitritireducens]